MKGLRYMLGSAASIVNATLLDIPDTTVELRIADCGHLNRLAAADPNQPEVPESEWTWNPVDGPMPVLPSPAATRDRYRRPSQQLRGDQAFAVPASDLKTIAQGQEPH